MLIIFITTFGYLWENGRLPWGAIVIALELRVALARCGGP
jgi:hypothetical protein